MGLLTGSLYVSAQICSKQGLTKCFSTHPLKKQKEFMHKGKFGVKKLFS